MKNQLLAVLFSAIVLFFWGFISWTVLPWHTMVSNQFTSESSVSQVLRENSPKAGIYYLPFSEQDQKPGRTSAFVNVLPNGLTMDMGQMMATALFGQVIAALLVLLLLQSTANLSYWQRVCFVTLVGVTIAFVSHFPYWTWFGFPTSYVLVTIADSAVAWFLAGLVMAKWIVGKEIST